MNVEKCLVLNEIKIIANVNQTILEQIWGFVSNQFTALVF